MPAKNKIIVPCAQCGKKIEKIPAKIKRAEHHFCNFECRVTWQRSQNGYAAGTEKTNCCFCGNEIERKRSEIKRRKFHFCNRECLAKWKRTQTGILAPRYENKLVQTTCFQCGKNIERYSSQIKESKNVFCGNKCYGEWKISQGETENIKIKCFQCEKEFIRKQSRVKKAEHHFCSVKCKAEWRTHNLLGDEHPGWKGGRINSYGPNWVRQARAARKRDDYCCQICGASQKGKTRALDVHHIVPFKSFEYIYGENENYLKANVLENLISLCFSCHRKVESNKLSLPVKEV